VSAPGPEFALSLTTRDSRDTKEIAMTVNFVTRGMLAAAMLALCTGGTVAWAQSSPPKPMQKSGEQRDTLAGADKDFLENAAQGGLAEVEGSKLAQSKSSNADVKQFAEQMITDHTKANQELIALAKQKGYTPPDEPSIIQRTKLKALSVMDGAGFDKMYASQIGVSAHEDTVELFQKASADAKDPDIKAWASKTLPTLEHHLEMAKALQEKVGKEGTSAEKKSQ
jgi:putative membrane protein